MLCSYHIEQIYIGMTESVRVMVRCRPMNGSQMDRHCKNVVQVEGNTQVRICKEEGKEKAFSFDHVFPSDAVQSYIYEQTAFSLVDSVLEGYNGTIFAYGQTGCGKTHTMMGRNDSEENRGIIPRTFSQIITLSAVETDKKHLVQCSFIEIYNEQIHDLLGKDIKTRMELKESPQKGVFVKDLSLNIVKTVSEMERWMDIGFKNRAVRETAMNKESSRSHSIFTIYIQSEQTDEAGNSKFKAGKLNLVDLAGSERQSKTNATGDGMKEAAKINLSLSALGNVISALVDGKTQHIPYRDSKLTRLLQDSLGGNTKTIMIAAVSPADYNYEETLSTLRYASRAKFIQNKPIINEDPKDTLLRQYADEIKALKLMLESKPGAPINPGFASNAPHYESELKSKEQMLKSEQEEKAKLRQQLQNLQKIVGKSAVDVDKKEVQRLGKLKEKLKTQKKKEQQWKKERKRRDEEMLQMEHSYKSLHEEAAELREKNMELRTRYIENLTELKDLKIEHEKEKEDLLDAIRNQQCQIDKYSAILRIMLTNEQLQEIIAKSEYNDESREWVIAPFYLRERSVQFPKVPNKDALLAERNKKEIVFKDAVPVKSSSMKYQLHEVVKGARETAAITLNKGNLHTISMQREAIFKEGYKEPPRQYLFKQKNNLQPIKSESQQTLRSDQQQPVGRMRLNPILRES